MAVQRPKVSLNNAVFPFVSSRAPRAVFMPQLDSAPRLARGFVGTEDSVDFNTAQILYGENFMPLSSGVRSVGYKQLIAPTVNTDFDTIFPLRDDEENTVLYSPSRGKNYIYDESAGMWSTTTINSIWSPSVVDPSLDPVNSRVTYAYVDGRTFVCYSRLKSATPPAAIDMSIMAWDPSTQTLVPATSLLANVPFPVGEIDGISSSNGFLLVWSGLTVAWAPFNGTQFNFSPFVNGNFTGAGNQIPEDVQGIITALIPISGGFIIFTTRNAVAASYYAQSIASPWIFREVPDAGGLESYEQASVEGTLGKVIAYTTAGLQEINLNSSNFIYPAVSDFVAGRKTERYDQPSHSIIPGGASIDLFVKVTAISSRYFVLSYGYYPGIYSYALVHDLALKRWGKLRIVHRDAFYYTQELAAQGVTYSMLLDVMYSDFAATAYEDLTVAGEGVSNAPHSLAFLLATGEVVNAIWSDDARDVPDTGVLVIGRVQLTRTSDIQLNRVELEGAENCNVLIQPSTNGKTLLPAEQLAVVEQVEDYLCVGSMIDCRNFNIVVEGQFNLSTLILEATTSGKGN